MVMLSFSARYWHLLFLLNLTYLAIEVGYRVNVFIFMDASFQRVCVCGEETFNAPAIIFHVVIIRTQKAYKSCCSSGIKFLSHKLNTLLNFLCLRIQINKFLFRYYVFPPKYHFQLFQL